MQLPAKHDAGIKARLVRWWLSQDSHIVDLVRGASIAGILKTFSAIFTFGLSVVLGRVLGAEGSGIYFLAFTIATIAATVGRVGLDGALLRLVASSASAGRWGEANRSHRAAIGICLAGSSLVAATLFIAAHLLADVVFSDVTLTGPIRVMTLAIVPLSLSVLVSRALQGLSRIRDSVLVFSILPTGIALGGTWILAYEWGVNGAIVAYVVAVTSALIYGIVAWNRALAGRSLGHQTQEVASPTKVLLKSGPPLLIGAILQLMMQMAGTLMLGAWVANTEVSLFAVAWRTAALVSFALLAINTIAQPKFAELFARGDMKSLAAAARKATLLMTACATPLFLLCLIAPRLVMSAFGDEFSVGAATLQILAVGQFVNVIAGSVGILLVMSAHEREYRNVQVIAASVVLTLNMLLIPTYGAIGAAIASATALIVQNILFGYFVWTKLGILMFIPRSLIKGSTDDA